MARIKNISHAIAAAAALAALFFAAPFAAPALAAGADLNEAGADIAPLYAGDFDSDAFKQALMQLKADHANAVSLIIPLVQSNVNSSDVSTGSQTPSDDSVARAIQYAHSLGLAVVLKPHLDPQDGQWRANINPNDRAAWFAAYDALITHYASLAQAQGVEHFIVGTELIDVSADDASPQDTPGWRKIIADVRAVYKGPVSYAANWGPAGTSLDEKNRIAFWDALDYASIDAYYPLNSDYNDNSAASFMSDWSGIEQSDIAPFEQKVQKPIVFSEVGYKSTGGAHLAPGVYQTNNGVNQDEQANAYEALFSYWNNSSYVKGIYLWEWVSQPSQNGQDVNYSPQNKEAEGVMARWFSGAGTATPSSNAPHALAASAANASASAPGSAVTLAASVQNTGQPEQNLIVDVEVYDASGNRVLQKFFDGESLAVGDTKNYAVQFTPASAGSYRVAVGVFGPGWSPNYAWNANAATVTVSSGVQAPPAAPAAFTAGASASAQSQVGQPMAFSASATDTGGAASALVDVEVYDSNNQKQFQQFFASQSFAAGETKNFSLNWTPGIAGTYRMASAVFSNDWSQLYAWNNQAATFLAVNGQPQTPPTQPAQPATPVQPTTPPQTPPSSATAGQSPLHNGNVQIVTSSIPAQPVAQGQTPSVGASLISQGDNANNVSVHVHLTNSSGAVAAESVATADILHDSQKSFSVAVPASLAPGSYAVSVVVINNADGLLNKRFDAIGTVQIIAQ